MVPDEDRFHFTATDDRSPSEVVVDAVAFVHGLDPLEIDPLGRVIDPRALDSLLATAEDLTVTFEFEGLEVVVRAPDEVLVSDPGEAGSIHDDLGEASTVLLSPQSNETDLCTDLVTPDDESDRNLLGVVYSSPGRRLERWHAGEDLPADTAIVTVGDFTRSAGTTEGTADGINPFSIDCLEDPTDLAALEAAITDRIDAFADADGRTLVCFDSVTDLLDHVGHDRATGFLEGIVERTRAAGATAHFHFHACEHEPETVAAVTDLFDAVVEVDDDGEWLVDR